MRPAQLTPENVVKLKILIAAVAGFNEAGAINAGKLSKTDLWVAGMTWLQ